MSKRRERPEGHHANERMSERYRIRISPKDYEDVIRQVVQGKARLVQDQVLNKIWAVQVQGQECYAVINDITKRVVTWLPKDGVQVKEWRAANGRA